MDGIGILFFFIIGIVIIPSIIFAFKEKSIIFFLFLLCLVYINVVIAEIYIRYKSIERFGIQPDYVDINLDMFYLNRGTPHATVCKDGKEYYWSFREKDFLFYFNSDCIDYKIKGAIK